MFFFLSIFQFAYKNRIQLIMCLLLITKSLKMALKLYRSFVLSDCYCREFKIVSGKATNDQQWKIDFQHEKRSHLARLQKRMGSSMRCAYSSQSLSPNFLLFLLLSQACRNHLQICKCVCVLGASAWERKVNSNAKNRYWIGMTSLFIGYFICEQWKRRILKVLIYFIHFFCFSHFSMLFKVRFSFPFFLLLSFIFFCCCSCHWWNWIERLNYIHMLKSVLYWCEWEKDLLIFFFS